MQHHLNLTSSKYPRPLLLQYESLVVTSVKPMINVADYIMILVIKGHGIRRHRHFVRDRPKFVPN